METHSNGHETQSKGRDMHLGCTSGESNVQLKVFLTHSVLVEVLDRSCEYNIGAIENNMIVLPGISETMGMLKANEWKMFVIKHISNGMIGTYNDSHYRYYTQEYQI